MVFLLLVAIFCYVWFLVVFYHQELGVLSSLCFLFRLTRSLLFAITLDLLQAWLGFGKNSIFQCCNAESYYQFSVVNALALLLILQSFAVICYLFQIHCS